MLTGSLTLIKTHAKPQLRRISPLHTSPSSQTLEQSLESAIQTKSYHQIPNLLLSNPNPNPNPNPFSFLSSFPPPLLTQTIDSILQSFIHVRPRSLPQTTYSLLLSHTLHSPNPFPLSLALLQRTLRSGCLPAKQTHLSLSSAWLLHRQHHSVSGILSAMRSIGYRPDTGICNYLLISLSALDRVEEAVRVLNCMGEVGCEPDSESYGVVIGALCGLRRIDEAVELVKCMGRLQNRVVLRQGTVVKLMAAMRANREINNAVKLLGLLERMGVGVGFEGYEMLVKGCLEKKDFVLGGKMVVEMLEKGFIPHIRVRQRVVEGLVGVGECEFAGIVRQKLASVGS